ncbi:hypothetical protein [Streptomyces sp. 1331.2]|uniref:hypothetical protein n=1 Tax=Streptomyces sp. 1331.2 TaxID=1938835 RepID=UPI000BCA7D11|nr:hypothetical protein [Streptomyces sp. 1331.2]SOB86116.1 hypothetical protein SAMN06272789_6421 [Streptomyces sp. 1331.2]
MSDHDHDTLGDRLRLLGTHVPAPILPAAEIRRRADRRRHRRRALGATAACTAAALCLALPSALHSPGPQPSPEPPQGAATTAASSASASPRPPAAFTVTSTATAPIDAGAVAGILGSCLGSDAPRYHAVIAVRTPVASSDTDGVVIAVDSAGQYVQCESKGHKGHSTSVPATFINDRLWGTGHLISFFDSFSTPTGAGQYLSLGAGHFTPEVAKVTISYGDDPTQYPAVMADGAFAYTAAISTGPDANAHPPTPYVHAYNADGKELYNQKTQPTTKNTHP